MNYNPYYMQQRTNNYGMASPNMNMGMAPPSAPSQIPALRGRPVASFDEVRATTIDFDGSVFIFPDFANKKIYTKQIGMDGTPSYNCYELAAFPPQNVTEPANFVTRDEFNQTLSQIKEAMTRLAATNQSQEPPKPEFTF